MADDEVAAPANTLARYPRLHIRDYVHAQSKRYEVWDGDRFISSHDSPPEADIAVSEFLGEEPSARVRMTAALWRLQQVEPRAALARASARIPSRFSGGSLDGEVKYGVRAREYVHQGPLATEFYRRERTVYVGGATHANDENQGRVSHFEYVLRSGQTRNGSLPQRHWVPAPACTAELARWSDDGGRE